MHVAKLELSLDCLDDLLAFRLVSLQVFFELLVLVRQYELVGQVILVKVIDQVPEELLG